MNRGEQTSRHTIRTKLLPFVNTYTYTDAYNYKYGYKYKYRGERRRAPTLWHFQAGVVQPRSRSQSLAPPAPTPATQTKSLQGDTITRRKVPAGNKLLGFEAITNKITG